MPQVLASFDSQMFPFITLPFGFLRAIGMYISVEALVFGGAILISKYFDSHSNDFYFREQLVWLTEKVLKVFEIEIAAVNVC